MEEITESYISTPSNTKNSCLDSKLENIFNNVNSWDEDSTKRLVKSLASLAMELKEELPHYDTVIGDDASGRLVTLFFRDMINRKRFELNMEPVSTYFLTPKQGRCEETNEAINEFISNRTSPMDKVLVVTEHIESGKSLGPIIRSLKKQQDVDFHIASISIDGNLLLPKDLHKKLTYASKSKDGLILYDRKSTGVTKERSEPGDIHPKKGKERNSQKSLTQARKDMGIIASEIYKLI